MRAQMGVVSLMAAACCSLVVTCLHADEECYKGFRSPTSEEKAAMQRVLERALGAIPSEIEGWSVSTDDALGVSSQCMDGAPRPWEYSFSRSFDRTDDREQRDAMLMKAGSQYQATRQANQPAMDAIMARIQELSQAAVAAAQAGDYDKVDAINAEIDKAVAQQETLMQGAQANLDAATDEGNRDMRIRVEVDVNPGWEQLGYESRTVTPPAGASHAFRWRDSSRGPGDETELVLIGSWRQKENSYDQVTRPGVAQAVPQGIAVSVTADEERIESVLAAIDFAALGTLVPR